MSIPLAFVLKHLSSTNLAFNALWEYNVMSDWIMSLICDSKSCDVLSETRRHCILSLLIGWSLSCMLLTACKVGPE